MTVPKERLDAFQTALRASFPDIALSTDAQTLAPYARDESDLGEFPPQLLMLAANTAQVSRALELATELHIPVTPVGARSGKSGGSLPIKGGEVRVLRSADNISVHVDMKGEQHHEHSN